MIEVSPRGEFSAVNTEDRHSSPPARARAGDLHREARDVDDADTDRELLRRARSEQEASGIFGVLKSQNVVQRGMASSGRAVTEGAVRSAPGMEVQPAATHRRELIAALEARPTSTSARTPASRFRLCLLAALSSPVRMTPGRVVVQSSASTHVQALAGSIALQGMLVPLVVRGYEDGFELVAGFTGSRRTIARPGRCPCCHPRRRDRGCRPRGREHHAQAAQLLRGGQGRPRHARPRPDRGRRCAGTRLAQAPRHGAREDPPAAQRDSS